MLEHERDAVERAAKALRNLASKFGGVDMGKAATTIVLDRSDEADARRFRWLLDGNGYFMQEQMLCGHGPCTEEEKDAARRQIDEAMASSLASAGEAHAGGMAET